MKPEIISRLVAINHQFYQSSAQSFSQTRQRVQPGVHSIIRDYIFSKKISGQTSNHILDIGCGNGELAHVLALSDWQGCYLGIDFSQPLIDQRNDSVNRLGFAASFQQVDVTNAEWADSLGQLQFDLILSFAVLHHIPGIFTRRQILQNVSRLLPKDGLFIFSVWQFLRSPRLTARIQPWSVVGMEEVEVDQDDYLLDWRANHETAAYRYVHHFSSFELQQLAQDTGFTIIESFDSDGKEGNLSVYQVWKKDS